MFFVDITWGIRWCKELHCIHIVRVEHWAVERSWKELDLTYPETLSELYVLRCIFLLFITLFGWLFLFWETWKGRPAELFRRTMTRASCLVSSDSPAACCLWFVSTCCRKYIFGRWGFQVYQTPLFTHQPRITSGDILSLWQGNYIPKCAGTVKMTVQSHTKSGHTTY